MRIRIFVNVFLLLALIAVIDSCGDREIDANSNIIPREKMIEILADLQIFESTQQILKDKGPTDVKAKRRSGRYPEIYGTDSSKNKKVDSEKHNFDLYRVYKWVFVHYEVTEQSFRESIEHYSNNPEEFETMYDEVLIRISEKQAELTSS